jgi:hypothetical protein
MSLGLEFAAVLMQVDLGVAEPQRYAPGTKCQLLHTEYLRVKPHGGVQIGDGQNQMIQPVDVTAAFSRRLTIRRRLTPTPSTLSLP